MLRNARLEPVWAWRLRADLGVMDHHTGNASADAMSIRNVPRPRRSALQPAHRPGRDGHCGRGRGLLARRVRPIGIPTNGGNQVPDRHRVRLARHLHRMLGQERWPDPRSSPCVTRWPPSSTVLDGPDGARKYAGRSQGKWDPGSLDMNWFRSGRPGPAWPVHPQADTRPRTRTSEVYPLRLHRRELPKTSGRPCNP